MTSAIETVSAQQLAAWLDDDGELTLLDVREQGEYARAHLFFAACLPLSRIELDIASRVPRRMTRIVLCDAGDASDAMARKAAGVLVGLGYGDVRVLEGGTAGWERAGYRIFSGIYVPSKAFGEVVEHDFDTPNLTAEDLADLKASGRPHRIFDCRPLVEYERMSIPGALNCPGAELLLRLPALHLSPETLVVVNCAGRTRSIIGAQTLIDAGFPNPVVALRNGTMGWELAGHAVDRGRKDQVEPPSPDGLAEAQGMVRAWGQRNRVDGMDWNRFCQIRAEGERTTYLFDVRDPSESATAMPPGAIAAPAGQLVQATDVYAPTLRSRLVLFDDKGIRNRMAAIWLARAGWSEVHVMDDAPLEPSRTADAGDVTPAELPKAASIDAGDLARSLHSGNDVLLDFATSAEFLKGHIAGAHFVIRSRLGAALPRLIARGVHADARLVLTSPDGRLARLAQAQAAALWRGDVVLLRGGTQGWVHAGLPLEHGFTETIEAPTDLWHTPSSEFGGGKPAMAEYIAWETGLIDRLDGEPGVRLRRKM